MDGNSLRVAKRVASRSVMELTSRSAPVLSLSAFWPSSLGKKRGGWLCEPVAVCVDKHHRNLDMTLGVTCLGSALPLCPLRHSK